ncbi:MAG: sporulation protein YunB [Turicibacter sp.]|nr:sporulation protein YunB [Turicibacter sp.]
MAKRRRRPKRRVRPYRPLFKSRGRKSIKFETKGLKRLLVLAVVCWGLWSVLSFMYHNMYAVVMNFASNQVVNIATAAINEGIIRSDMGGEDPMGFITITDSGDTVVNQMRINQYRANISREIVDILQHVQKGDLTALGLESFQTESAQNGVLFEVPWAAAFNMTLLHEWGPRFPVRTRMMGNVDTDVEIQIEPYGINNAVLTVNLWVTSDIQVALPFRSQVEPIRTQIPLISSVLRGEIPQFYWSSLGSGDAAPPPVLLPPTN